MNLDAGTMENGGNGELDPDEVAPKWEKPPA
jgi:hypothetical protein